MRRQINPCRWLLVIDNAPLQAAAWAEFLRARKRLEKATRDVHRHEERDVPAFRSWLARTFPTLLSSLRELALQVESKQRLIAAVEHESFFSGRPPARIWREWQRNGGRPPPFESGDPAGEPFRDDADTAFATDAAEAEDVFDEEVKRMFEREGVDDDDPMAREFREFARDVLGLEDCRHASPVASAARDLYRRLVRHLHPDRGGEWTTTRARLWEQVQQAWAECDADWLARLEVEWEASADLLGPESPVGRLRAALCEIDAARRDAERRVREYRKDIAWRFSLADVSEDFRTRIRRKLRDDEAVLREQLADFEAVTAAWERSSRRRAGLRRSKAVQYDVF